MPKSETLLALMRLLRKVVIVDALLMLAVGVFCFAMGRRTVYQYGDALVKVGVVCLIIMLATNLGGTISRGDDVEAFSITRSMRMDEVLQRSTRDSETRQLVLLVSILALGTVIVIGAALLNLP